MLMSYACASLNRSRDLKSSIKENPPSFFIDVWEEGSTIRTKGKIYITIMELYDVTESDQTLKQYTATM